jgi:hypothetical protein
MMAEGTMMVGMMVGKGVVMVRSFRDVPLQYQLLQYQLRFVTGMMRLSCQSCWQIYIEFTFKVFLAFFL